MTDCVASDPEFGETTPMTSRPESLFACLLIFAAACGDDGSDTAAGTGDPDTGGGTADPDTTTGVVDPDDGTSTGSSTDAPDDTAEDSGTGEPLTRLETILQALNVAMFQCTGRAWPGITANIQASQILLVSEQDGAAYLWNDQRLAATPPELTEVDFASLGPEWLSTFGVGTYNDVVTLGISLDDTAEVNAQMEEAGMPPWHDYALELAFHEGMHFLSGQDDWNVGPGSRSLPYPEPWEPRYLRAQLGWALRGQLEAGTTDFGAAAFWRETVRGSFPTDMTAIAAYDITEGSAEYGSTMMSALAALGCTATDEALVDAVVERLDTYAALSHYSGGREPYDLGVLAGLSLQRVGADGWQGLVENGATMQELLLSQADPQVQPDDAEVQAEAQAAVDARNVLAAERIEPMLANMADAAFYRLPVPFDWIQGSFSPGGFYYLADDPDQTQLLLSYSALHESTGGTAIEVEALTSLLGVANPCAVGQGTIVLLVPAVDTTDNDDGTYTSSNAQVTFDGLTATVIDDDDMLPWLCPEELAAHAHGPFGKIGIMKSADGRPMLHRW